MTTNLNSNRSIGIVLSARGLGFAVIESNRSLVDWGSFAASKDKNRKCLQKIENLIQRYTPDRILLKDCAGSSQNSLRLASLQDRVLKLIKKNSIPCELMSRQSLKLNFGKLGLRNKHEMAVILASKYPNELKHDLPAKRRTSTSESPKMVTFEALTLLFPFDETQKGQPLT